MSRRPGARRGGQHPRHPQRARGACRTEVGRVIYGSTTWVYSDCPEQDVNEQTPIPAPRHIYTATKLAGETYCAGYSELYDLDSTILRFGIPYGPRARAAGVVAEFTDLSFEGKALRSPATAADPQLHLRRGSRDGIVRRSPPRPPVAPTTSPVTRS